MGDNKQPTSIDNQLYEVINDIASATSEVQIKHYFSRQILNDITMPQYQIGESMRIWLIEFRQQAEFAGVEDTTECIRIIGRFMPTAILCCTQNPLFEPSKQTRRNVLGNISRLNIFFRSFIA